MAKYHHEEPRPFFDRCRAVAVASVIVAVIVVLIFVSISSSSGSKSFYPITGITAGMGACVCADVYAPVCANSDTFPNACEAKCLGLEIQYEGECELPSHCLNCSESYAPVCGSDKITYLNTCVAECSRVSVVRQGVCSTTLVIKPRPARANSLG
ncbi:hypothetical protein CEUSTIGMA_g5692.t1 [Chlamydomonas eustigma]|uniref:Kazal-like domain-containing protein n=1 Tax=Chlamydomonas eustigma TaxID=1157962 RepID=A0A250X649_9CHLO|nr:hypothetical protein CEUSTIGMA_g5692.t1 [Chlamydomonas eustigma]|eukprot:GAX78250.1 hypothetical protein CEUSTIGMA_g5692.t1 [Chlamydomonas eustigma]